MGDEAIAGVLSLKDLIGSSFELLNGDWMLIHGAAIPGAYCGSDAVITHDKLKEIERIIPRLHFLKKRLTLHGQGHKALGQLEDFPWQPPDGGKRR